MNHLLLQHYLYKDFLLFGTINLPIKLKTTTYKEYTYVEETLSENEAKDLAISKLTEEINISLENSELISKNVKHFIDYSNYYIECDIYCYENIADIVKFYVNEK